MFNKLNLHLISRIILLIVFFVLGSFLALADWEFNPVIASEQTTAYSEGWYHNHTDPVVVSINSINTYYNITGFNLGEVKNMVFEDNGVTVSLDGHYKFDASVSFSGGNAGDYDFEMAVDGVPIKSCGMARTTSSNAIGNIGLTCIVMLNSSNHLNLQVEDLSAPAQNIQIYVMNLNIERIGS